MIENTDNCAVPDGQAMSPFAKLNYFGPCCNIKSKLLTTVQCSYFYMYVHGVCMYVCTQIQMFLEYPITERSDITGLGDITLQMSPSSTEKTTSQTKLLKTYV